MIVRAVLDDLRSRRVPLGQFLAKQEIARRMRRAQHRRGGGQDLQRGRPKSKFSSSIKASLMQNASGTLGQAVAEEDEGRESLRRKT